MKRVPVVSFLVILLVSIFAGATLVPEAHADGYIDFEDGSDGQVIRSTIPGLQFTTTQGQDWIYGDWRTGDYNGPYPNGAYVSNGNFFAWLGPNQGAGRIDFIDGCATYVQAYVSTYSGLTADAYYMDGRLAASASVGGNLNTGHMSRLRVNAVPGDCFHYVIFHDSGNFWLIDDLSTDAAGVPETRPPVILLPGLMGSRLDAYNVCAGEDAGDAEEVWPAIPKLFMGDGHLDVLRLASNGRDPASSCSRVAVGRVTDEHFENGAIRSIELLSVEEEFYARLADQLRLKGFTVYGYGYDWRLDLRTIVDRPGASNDLDDFVDQVLLETGAAQVNLVGHSLGGLVARHYVTSNPLHQAKVEQVITLGTPYLGAPQSLKALRWGDPVTPFPINLVLSVDEAKAKELLANAPSFYQILPSRRYFAVAGGYYSREGLLASWDQTTQLLHTQHNSLLASDADLFHSAAMDDWGSFESTVAFRLIVGSGRHDTPGILREFVTYDYEGLPHTYFRTEGVNGDGTVPLPSASLRGRGHDYSGDTAIWFTRNLDHGQLAKEPYVVDFVGALLATPPDLQTTLAASQAAPPLDPNAPPLYRGPADLFPAPANHDNTPPPPAEMSTAPFAARGGQITAVGDVQVHVYDDQERHTGPVFGGHEADIPGSAYSRLGNTTTISLPADGQYHVKVVSPEGATFDLRFENLEGIEGNLVQRTITYADVLLEDSGQAMADYSPLAATTAPELQLDRDGNGGIEETMPPTGDVGPEGSADATEPDLHVGIDGIQDEFGNYIGMVRVTLTATDAGTGVARVAYFDEAGVDQTYTGPFLLNAFSLDTVVAHAVDQAGNEGWALLDLHPVDMQQLRLPVILGR